MWTKLWEKTKAAMRNSPTVVNHYNNSTVVHDHSPTHHAAPRAIDLSNDAMKYCEAIGIDPNAPIKARSPPKSTKGPSPVESPEDECLCNFNRNLFTGAPF
jgi:hypothetical protein